MPRKGTTTRVASRVDSGHRRSSRDRVRLRDGGRRAPCMYCLLLRHPTMLRTCCCCITCARAREVSFCEPVSVRTSERCGETQASGTHNCKSTRRNEKRWWPGRHPLWKLRPLASLRRRMVGRRTCSPSVPSPWWRQGGSADNERGFDVEQARRANEDNHRMRVIHCGPLPGRPLRVKSWTRGSR